MKSNLWLRLFALAALLALVMPLSSARAEPPAAALAQSEDPVRARPGSAAVLLCCG